MTGHRLLLALAQLESAGADTGLGVRIGPDGSFELVAIGEPQRAQRALKWACARATVALAVEKMIN